LAVNVKLEEIGYNVPMKTKLGVLISGRGSNMQALAEACDEGRIPAEIALVLSNKKTAAGLEWARAHGLNVEVLAHGDFSSREAHDQAIVHQLNRAKVDWVCLAGYMRLLSPVLVKAFKHRILNIHPSLLPSFPGLDAQTQAVDFGVRVSGCTVHLVDEKLDHGPIVVQRTVEVLPCDSAEDLAGRIIVEEHRAYPDAVRRLIENAWHTDGRRIIWNSYRE
jgi:phosphoribosylglycinamide formyltransferase-1